MTRQLSQFHAVPAPPAVWRRRRHFIVTLAGLVTLSLAACTGEMSQGDEEGDRERTTSLNCAAIGGDGDFGTMPRTLRVITAPTQCPLSTDCPVNGEKVSAYARQVVAMRPDVLVATEAFWGTGFETKVRQALQAGLGGTWMSKRGPEDGTFTGTGGIAIFSRFPIKRFVEEVYEDCHQPDCLVNKGVFAATLDLGYLPDGTPVELEVIGTHLQAISAGSILGIDFTDVHRKQVEQLGRFMRRHRPESTESAHLKIFTGDLNTSDTPPSWLGQWRLGLGRSFDAFRSEWVLEPTGLLSAARTCEAGVDARSCILGPWRSYPTQAPYPFEHPSMEETVIKQYYGGRGRYYSSCRNGYHEIYMAPRTLSGRDYATQSLQTERALAFDHAPVIVDYELAVNPVVFGSHYELNGRPTVEDQLFYFADGADVLYDPTRGPDVDPFDPGSEYVFPFKGTSTHGPSALPGWGAHYAHAQAACAALGQLPPPAAYDGRQRGGSPVPTVAVNGRALPIRGLPRGLDRGLNRVRCLSRKGGVVAVLANPLVEAAGATPVQQAARLSALRDRIYGVTGDPAKALGPAPAGTLLLPPTPSRYRTISELGIEQAGIRFVSTDRLPNPDPAIGLDCARHARYACGHAAGLQVKSSQASKNALGESLCTYECREAALAAPADPPGPKSNNDSTH